MSPRETALELLTDRERTGNDITELLKDALDDCGASLSVRDRAFLKQLAIGTVERLITIDAVLGECLSSGRGLKGLKPRVRCILRLGAYQILFMDGVRDAAAVDESVKLSKAKGCAGLSGLVNGVLRRIAREKTAILEKDRGTAVNHSVPEYVCGLIERERGSEAAGQIFASLYEPRPVTVRPDPRLLRDGARFSLWMASLREAVEKAGGSVKDHPFVKPCLNIFGGGDITELPGYDEGDFAVQDAAAVLAVAAAGIKPENRVLDVCAAPGGKAVYAAAMLADPAQMTARDASESRMSAVRENARRMKLDGMRTEVRDAAVHDPADDGLYDVVICDVPCTGFGVMGRKPEIKYQASEKKTESLVRLQRDILEVSARYVKPGGILIYSTCTVSRRENEDNAAWFEESFGFVGEDPENGDAYGFENGRLQLLPGEHCTDGFFIARFRNDEGR